MKKTARASRFWRSYLACARHQQDVQPPQEAIGVGAIAQVDRNPHFTHRRVLRGRAVLMPNLMLWTGRIHQLVLTIKDG